MFHLVTHSTHLFTITWHRIMLNFLQRQDFVVVNLTPSVNLQSLLGIKGLIKVDEVF